MNVVRNFSLAALIFIATALPAMAGTTVSSPTDGAQVSSPFNLTMNADTCSGRTVMVVGYSLDNSTSTAIFAGQQMNGPVSASDGSHTLHVKVWNDGGDVCVTDIGFNVGGGGGGGGATSVIPSNAVRVSSIQALDNWKQGHDGGTPGWSSGWMGIQSSPSLTGSAREFATNFHDFGGERYSVHFDDNPSSQNFFYDAWIYIASSADGFSNLEFDLNQTMPNGETVIMGFQCDSWVNRWDYTINGGSPTQPWDTWQHSYAPCNVHTWGTNQWHHIQIYYSHNESGWVTYHTVWLDGNRQDLNITAFSSFALGWGPAIIANFQIDGASGGDSYGKVYLDEMTVYRW